MQRWRLDIEDCFQYQYYNSLLMKIFQRGTYAFTGYEKKMSPFMGPKGIMENHNISLLFSRA
ncbi:hypothetical protein TRIP_C20375 [Candidatus Zixiibacteriota bacterium]|nr:hypothetical protein TRIP_C20375 [candidate division Zixibacteria bacterium]